MKRLLSSLALFAVLAACSASPVLAATKMGETSVSKALEAVQKDAPPVAASAADALKSISHDATGVVDKVIDKASAALGEITSKLESTAPKAWSMVVSGTKAKAEATLLVGILLTVSALGSWLTFSNFIKKADFGCDPNRYAFFSIAFFVGSIATSVVASSYLLSSDAWAAYLSPEGYLALQILQTALAHT